MNQIYIYRCNFLLLLHYSIYIYIYVWFNIYKTTPLNYTYLFSLTYLLNIVLIGCNLLFDQIFTNKISIDPIL